MAPMAPPACLALQTLRDHIVAESLGEIHPQRLPVSIGEEGGIVELIETRQRILLDRIAQPHRRIRIDLADGEIFRHPFHEPERQRRHRPAGPLQDVSLERVDQLVPEHVIGFAEAGGKRQHDASFLVLRDAADAVAQVAGDDVGLRELGVARVEHDRLTLGEGVVEDLRQAGVPALRQAAGLHHGVVLGGVVIDVEVRGLENLKIEILVAHFVSPERLRMAGRHRRKSHEALRPPRV